MKRVSGPAYGDSLSVLAQRRVTAEDGERIFEEYTRTRKAKLSECTETKKTFFSNKTSEAEMTQVISVSKEKTRRLQTVR